MSETGIVELSMEEWKKIHRDYKGTLNGQRHMLKNCGGLGTCMVPVKIVKK